MFGGSSSSPTSPEGEKEHSSGMSLLSHAHHSHDNRGTSVRLSDDPATGSEKRHTGHRVEASPSRKSTDDSVPSGGDKKRRSGKASSLFASARNSLHLPGSLTSHSSSSSSGSSDAADQAPNALQKLGKHDPALAVPQGSHNNSAGESLPGARSTFRVGVTEDRNKKCRRTMEDTHAYLYNFLNTPAPALELDEGTDKSDGDAAPVATHASEPAQHDDQAAVTLHAAETDNGYFAIFDGHAGTFVADWCGKKLHGILEDAIRKNPNTPIPDLLDQTFTRVDHELEKLPLKNSGCTAAIAVLRWEDRVPSSQSATGSAAVASAVAAAAAAAAAARAAAAPADSGPSSTGTRDPAATGSGAETSSVPVPPTNAATSPSPPPPAQAAQQLQQAATRQRVLYTANVGDARIVLCRGGKALRLSYDHKGSDENEGKRVANAGGLILNNRVNGVLAVTRALGDTYMKDLVTGHPYTTETVIQPVADELMILACDGLWDVCSDQEAVDLIRHVTDAQAASKMLVEHALARFSTDNLSCMIVRFDAQAVQRTVDHHAAPIGVEGDPVSRGARLSEADALVLKAQQKLLREEAAERDRAAAAGGGGAPPARKEHAESGSAMPPVVRERMEKETDTAGTSAT
ncbi:MAG: Protein phosphatase 2C 1 [Phylliscum demangeonii]|nr:MAG: Protein phosphatase 2C 1 [Phylliscum demangeonii]